MAKNITLLKSKSNGLTWINIVNAGKQEIEYLRRKFKFKDLDLADSYGRKYAQRPKLHIRTHYAFLILQFPFYNSRTKTVHTEEVDFFITTNHLITIHKNKLQPLRQMFDECSRDDFYRRQCMGDISGYLLYEIILRLQQHVYPIMDQISADIVAIEENIFANQEKQMIREISYIKRNIYDSRRIMQAHKNTLQKFLEEKSSVFPREPLKIYFHSLIEHSKNIWDILEGQKESIESLEQTNSALVGDKLSNIMKLLTIFSVVVFPLNLLAAIFGMNTMNGMPFIATDNGFWIIVIIMLIGVVGMFLFFKKKKWL